MKFDPFTWNEVKTNEKIQHPKGWLRLRVSAPAPLYIEAEGVEALYGYGTEFEVETSEAVIARIEAPKGVRAFLHRPLPSSTVAGGEVFTNIDRMPHESGAVAEVTRARRQLELERRAMLRDIRAERDAVLERLRAVTPATPAEAVPRPVDQVTSAAAAAPATEAVVE